MPHPTTVTPESVQFVSQYVDNRRQRMYYLRVQTSAHIGRDELNAMVMRDALPRLAAANLPDGFELSGSDFGQLHDEAWVDLSIRSDCTSREIIRADGSQEIMSLVGARASGHGQQVVVELEGTDGERHTVSIGSDQAVNLAHHLLSAWRDVEARIHRPDNPKSGAPIVDRRDGRIPPPLWWS